MRGCWLNWSRDLTSFACLLATDSVSAIKLLQEYVRHDRQGIGQ